MCDFLDSLQNQPLVCTNSSGCTSPAGRLQFSGVLTREQSCSGSPAEHSNSLTSPLPSLSLEPSKVHRKTLPQKKPSRCTRGARRRGQPGRGAGVASGALAQTLW